MFVGSIIHACPALPLLGGVCLQAQVWGLSEPNYSYKHNQEKGQCHPWLMKQLPTFQTTFPETSFLHEVSPVVIHPFPLLNHFRHQHLQAFSTTFFFHL